jgi:hypothetical protein
MSADLFRETIEKLTAHKYDTFPAVVTEVGQDSVTVVPVGSEAELFEVRLRAALDESDQGVIVVPKAGSSVLVTKIGGSLEECFVSMVSEPESVRVKIGDTTLLMDSSGVTINDGTLGGLIKIKELKADLEKINVFLNAIKQAFNTWIPVPMDGGAALKGVMSGALSPLQLPNYSKIENEKVKH